jgi:hypothetical protein
MLIYNKKERNLKSLNDEGFSKLQLNNSNHLEIKKPNEAIDSNWALQRGLFSNMAENLSNMNTFLDKRNPTNKSHKVEPQKPFSKKVKINENSINESHFNESFSKLNKIKTDCNNNEDNQLLLNINKQRSREVDRKMTLYNTELNSSFYENIYKKFNQENKKSLNKNYSHEKLVEVNNYNNSLHKVHNNSNHQTHHTKINNKHVNNHHGSHIRTKSPDKIKKSEKQEEKTKIESSKAEEKQKQKFLSPSPQKQSAKIVIDSNFSISSNKIKPPDRPMRLSPEKGTDVIEERRTSFPKPKKSFKNLIESKSQKGSPAQGPLDIPRLSNKKTINTNNNKKMNKSYTNAKYLMKKTIIDSEVFPLIKTKTIAKTGNRSFIENDYLPPLKKDTTEEKSQKHKSNFRKLFCCIPLPNK